MSVTVFPSVDGWITPRTDEVQLTDQNCKIIVSKPIEKISKVLMYTNESASMKFFNSQTQKFQDAYLKDLYKDAELTIPAQPFDITQFVVEYDLYKTLTLYNNIVNVSGYKNTAWHYSYGSKEITLINDKEALYSGYVFQNILRVILQQPYYVQTEQGVMGVTQTDAYAPVGELMNTRFRVYYEPLGESVKVSTLKTEPVENEFAIPFSQQQQIVNNMSLGRNMQATANRTGVETRTICRKVDTIAKIRKVGTVWVDNQGNKWRLTTNTIDFSCGWAYCTETWSKNWMMQSEFVGINREFRSWNIPANTVVRNYVREEYCLITNLSGLYDSATSLQNKTKELIVRTCDNSYESETNDEATVAQILDGNGNGGIVNVSAFGFGNTIVISGTTKDNLSIGIQRVESEDDGGETKRFCKDVYYTDENGEAQKLQIRIGNKVSNSDLDLYPQSNAVTNIISDALDTLAYFHDGNFQKDASEKINFALQIHFISGDEDLIIGPGLASNCPLAKNKVAGKLKTWVLDKALPQGATVMTSEWGHVVTQQRVTANAGAGTVSISFATCLTDENNNIIIANNNRDYINKTYRFVFSSNYDRIKNIILTQTDSNYRDAIAE